MWYRLLLSAVFLWPATLLAAPSAATRPGLVQVDLIVGPRAPLTAAQQWARAMAQAGLTGVRVRSGGTSARVGIDVRGTRAAPVYIVTGLITSGNQLVTPAGRFDLDEVDRFARWLDDLAKNGPPDQRPQQAAFALTPGQLQEVHTALSRPVGFATGGLSRAEVVRRIAARLSLPLRVDAKAQQVLARETVSTDLSPLSCGTALAYVLRGPGMALVPRAADGRLELHVLPAQPEMEIWPVGWKPDKPTREVLPRLLEFLNVNVQGVPVTQVLAAVHQRLDVPVLLDHNAMARHGIEPQEAIVNLPQRRTTYGLLLRRTLFQAKLKSEVRVDEAGKPLLWITTLKPL